MASDFLWFRIMVGEFVTRHRTKILLCAILLLSAFLNFWNIWNEGFSNTYYAAAVRSMLENPGVAFFNSFDAAGFVTIDKPPVGLWVQCISAIIFGYSGWALILPQALAGVGSVALIYVIVSQPFGEHAGLVSAFALAVTPIFVAVSRNGTIDGLLIFILLLSLWAGLKAAREKSFPLLLISVVLIGIGFNIKMIQALVVVPAVFAMYILGMQNRPRKKQVLHLGLALLVLGAVSLSWAVAVDLIPASQRPYIGGSGDNTVLGLIVNYNGLHRLENGMITGGDGKGGVFPGTGIPPGGGAGQAVDPETVRDRSMAARVEGSSLDPVLAPRGEGFGPSAAGGPAGLPAPMSAGDGKGGGMMDENGTPGLFRLFGEGLACQISWLLPFSLIGLLAWWRCPTRLPLKVFDNAGLFTERGLTLLALSLWLLPGLLYFSFTTGFWHTYYLATIAPPLAALTGIGAACMYGLYQSSETKGWLLVVAIALTGLTEVLFMYYNAAWSGLLVPAILAGIIVMTVLLALFRCRIGGGSGNLSRILAIVAIAILFIAPFVWACTPLVYGNTGLLPVAGPRIETAGNGMGNGFGETWIGTARLAEYLVSHKTGETWIVAVASSNNEGATLIIDTGEPVMSLGGFGGSDQILTADSFKGLIDAGRIRYVLGSSVNAVGGPLSSNAEIISWVNDHCAEVPAADWGGIPAIPGGSPSGVSGALNSTIPAHPAFSRPTGSGAAGPGNQDMLFDCAGYRGQTGT